MKSDHIKWMITLTGDNIKRLSLYLEIKIFKIRTICNLIQNHVGLFKLQNKNRLIILNIFKKYEKSKLSFYCYPLFVQNVKTKFQAITLWAKLKIKDRPIIFFPFFFYLNTHTRTHIDLAVELVHLRIFFLWKCIHARTRTHTYSHTHTLTQILLSLSCSFLKTFFNTPTSDEKLSL